LVKKKLYIQGGLRTRSLEVKEEEREVAEDDERGVE
jgi:hypothetical protein